MGTRVPDTRVTGLPPIYSFLVATLVCTMWTHARVVTPRDSRAVLASLPYWPFAILALRSGGGSGHVSGPEPRWALGFRIREPPGYRPSLTFSGIINLGSRGWYSPSKVAWRPEGGPCQDPFNPPSSGTKGALN